MLLNRKRQAFGPSCPSGGVWYSCGYGSHFVGCCRSQPCTGDCPAGNLEPASFDPGYYGQFPDQQCPAGSLWYTCKYTTPTFMGCCKSNPCHKDQGGCPAVNLTAGFLSSNPADAAVFSPSGGSSKSAPVGAIAGGATGGVAVLAILIAILIYYYRRAAKSRKARNGEANIQLSPPTATATGGDSKATPILDSSLPAYSTSAPYDPAVKPTFELPAGYVPYSRNENGEPGSPTQSITRKSLPHRLSELSGESARAELESPHNSPALQSPQSSPQVSYNPPRSPQSTRSSGANWTRLPWVRSTDAGMGIEEERRESGGRRATYEGT